MISEFLGNNIPEDYTQIIAEGVFGRGYESLSFVGLDQNGIRTVMDMFGPGVPVTHLILYNLDLTNNIRLDDCQLEAIEMYNCNFLERSALILPLYSNVTITDTAFVNMRIAFDQRYCPIGEQDVPPVIAQALHKYNTVTFERCKFVQEGIKTSMNVFDSMISTCFGPYNPNCVATLVISDCDVDVFRNFIDDWLLDLIILQNNRIKASELFHPKTHMAILRDNVFEHLDYYLNFNEPIHMPHGGKVTELIEIGTKWAGKIPLSVRNNRKHPNIKWLKSVTDVVDHV